MSKTVSFVARDELAEWLESKAEAEMKSISAVCQEIVAAEYRRQTRLNPAKPGDVPEDAPTDRERMRELGFLDEDEETGPLEEPPFATYPDAWYEPDTEDPDEIVAVRIPEEHQGAEDRRYYKTYEGAATAIRRWYE